MIAKLKLFFVLLITVVQSQNIAVNFPTFPVNTDIGTCTCDLTENSCDVSCCCDPDCSTNDKYLFNCDTRANQYTNSTPILSTVQPSCFKNISIFYSNSPYIIQKMGELVCIDYARYSGSQYYQQPNVQNLNAGDFVRMINAENSVVASAGLPTGLSNYQVGTPVLIFNNNTAAPGLYSLPIGFFDNQICSGSQQITYMNDFTSTCIQPVSQDSCSGALNPVMYGNPLCLIRTPTNPNDSSTYICSNTTVSPSSFASPSCSNALQSLTVTIYYTNPTGITSFSVSSTTATASTTTSFRQTFSVRFIKTGSSASTTTRNPGYLQGANIIAGITNGSTIGLLTSDQFALIKPVSSGLCDLAGERIPIRFGQNVQSTCIYNSTAACTDLPSILIPVSSTNVSVAAYSNPNPANISSDWLPVISCTSDIGAPSTTRLCQLGIINSMTNSTCYTRLDIQIAYTKIGSVANPQSVLSAVIFHYQRDTTAVVPRLVTKTVTFQDISAAPIVIQGSIPAPNTRLPANFFYPFSVSRATPSKTFSSWSVVIISILCILI